MYFGKLSFSGLKVLVSDKTRDLLAENKSFQFKQNEHHDAKVYLIIHILMLSDASSFHIR